MDPVPPRETFEHGRHGDRGRRLRKAAEGEEGERGRDVELMVAVVVVVATGSVGERHVLGRLASVSERVEVDPGEVEVGRQRRRILILLDQGHPTRHGHALPIDRRREEEIHHLVEDAPRGRRRSRPRALGLQRQGPLPPLGLLLALPLVYLLDRPYRVLDRADEVVELDACLEFVSADGAGIADFDPSRDAGQAEEMAARCQDVLLPVEADATAVVGVFLFLLKSYTPS